MTKRIWKFEIPITDVYEVSMPTGAEIIYVAPDDGRPNNTSIFMWVEVNPERETKNYTFRIIGTGHPITEKEDKYLIHVGSVVKPPFVWHLYEERGAVDYASAFLSKL